MTRIELMAEINKFIADNEEKFYSFDIDAVEEEKPVEPVTEKPEEILVESQAIEVEKTEPFDGYLEVEQEEIEKVAFVQLMAGVKKETWGRTSAVFFSIIEEKPADFKRWVAIAEEKYKEFAPVGSKVSAGYMKKVVQKFAKTGVVAEWDGKAKTPINWLI